MPLESATYIGDLNIANPAGADSKSQGDDHLRLIKSVLKNTFPSNVGVYAPLTIQLRTSTGTWTKPAGCRFVIMEGCGGGGAGGGVDGQGAGTAGGGGGGTTGAYGKTSLIDVTAIVSATATIGAGGTGVSGGAGNPGGDTSITLGATTYTWPGGGGAAQCIATISNGKMSFPGSPFGGTNVSANCMLGGFGHSNANDDVAIGGAGGRVPNGMSGGGYPVIQTSAGVTAGTVATGNGGGGGGAVAVDTASNAAGGAGTAGFIKFWEFY